MVQFPDPLDEAFPLGDGVAEGSVWAHCPYCGEPIELLVDAGGGTEQDYIEDCEVCCRPMVIRLRWSGGTPVVDVAAEDD